MHDPRERLIVALDVSSAAEARQVVAAVSDSASIYKVGMQLFTAEGPQVVLDLVQAGRRVFLDLKYHDIPNTVASAVKDAAALGVSMLTVHACGGSKMLRAAAEAAAAKADLIVLAVTVLTSMDGEDLAETGVTRGVEEQVSALAGMAIEAGCGGIVSSAKEVKMLRRQLGNDVALVTPGVRPAGASHGDQARVVTPAQAIAEGASHIVVGRPITGAPDPAAAARAIVDELRGTQGPSASLGMTRS
jgi:orotidine-5'-phosphate decarboxylase